MHYHPAMTRATLTTAVVAAVLAVAAPAHAINGGPDRVFPKAPGVSAAAYDEAHQWDAKSHVELVWNRSGHFVRAFQDSDGHKMREKHYPTTDAGGYIDATFMRYTLDPVSDPHPDYTWALYSKSWCTADDVCS